jgi:hypothetical protein
MRRLTQRIYNALVIISLADECVFFPFQWTVTKYSIGKMIVDFA